MIEMEEIREDGLAQYWRLHWEYLSRDLFPAAEPPFDDEDREYYRGDEYRSAMFRHMSDAVNSAHMLYFVRDGVRIGCAQYIIYRSEQAQCMLMDFWVFPEHRGRGAGHECYRVLSERLKGEGASRVEINVSNERSRRFWLHAGFLDAGVDEYGMAVMQGSLPA